MFSSIFHRNRARLFLATIALPFLATVYSMEAEQLPAHASLKEYLEYAQIHNPELQAFEKRYQAALQRIPQAAALPDPRLQVTHFVESVQTRTGPQENVYLLNQSVPWFGSLRNRKESASYEAEALWYAYQQKQLTLAREVALVYYEYGYLGKALQLTQENLELLNELEPIVTHKVQAGSNLNSLLRLQVELGKIEDKSRNLEQTRQIQNAKLVALLNLDGNSLLPWPQWDAPKIQQFDILPLSLALVENNPELQMLDRKIKSRTAQVELAKLENYPDFTVGLNYIQTGKIIGASTFNNGTDPWGFTVAVNLPLQFKKNRAKQKEALFNKLSDVNIRANRENNLKADLHIHLANLENSHRRLKLYGEDLLDKAKQALEISQSGYQSGHIGILEVIDSERSLLELQLIYWKAAADAWQSRVQIQALTNQPLLSTSPSSDIK